MNEIYRIIDIYIYIYVYLRIYVCIILYYIYTYYNIHMIYIYILYIVICLDRSNPANVGHCVVESKSAFAKCSALSKDSAVTECALLSNLLQLYYRAMAK